MRNFETSLKQYCEENDLLFLLEEYAPDNDLNPSEIGAHSTTLVKWRCAYGHEEIESPFKRLRRRFCSICGKRRRGSFAQVHPDMLKQWSKANNVSPEMIPPTYSKQIIWECEHGHTWHRTIRLQAQLKTCPYCAVKENGFFACHPEMLEEWDADRNKGIEPDTVTAFSNRKYHWICRNGHSYSASPTELMRRSAHCPICSSFGYARPDLIHEWHPTKNGDKTPFDYSVNSQVNAWFICSVCTNEYTAKIANRAKRIYVGCPHCTPYHK